jgi:hypothetical protein
MSNRPATSVEYRYDAFISYSHTDETWVRDELLPRLERAALKVIIDYRDFEPGAPLLTEMERAVIQSWKTVLVLTPAYLKSEWTEFENILAQTLDPGARRRRVVPVMLKPCQLPLRIRSLVYIDFSPSRSSEAQFQRLLKALNAEDSSRSEETEPNEHEAMPVAFLRLKSDRHDIVHRIKEPVTVIGRANECQLEIPDECDNVERYHTTIFYKDGIFAIADGYQNRPTEFGTFVNGVKVKPKTKMPLRHDDQIVLGGFRHKEAHELSRGACKIVFERKS